MVWGLSPELMATPPSLCWSALARAPAGLPWNPSPWCLGWLGWVMEGCPWPCSAHSSLWEGL